MKLKEHIQQQEAWLQQIREHADETRDGAKKYVEMAAEPADPADKAWCLRLSKQMERGAVLFDRQAEELEKQIARLRELDEKGDWELL